MWHRYCISQAKTLAIIPSACMSVCNLLNYPSRLGDFLCFITKIACFLKYIRSIFILLLKQERNIRTRKTIVCYALSSLIYLTLLVNYSA